MAEQKRYTVHRSMHGDGKDYEAGDTRLMTEADAAELVKFGALSLEGEEPAAREPAVRHTFGTEPSKVNTEGYTVATGEPVSLNRDTPATKPARKAKAEA